MIWANLYRNMDVNLEEGMRLHKKSQVLLAEVREILDNERGEVVKFE